MPLMLSLERESSVPEYITKRLFDQVVKRYREILYEENDTPDIDRIEDFVMRDVISWISSDYDEIMKDVSRWKSDPDYRDGVLSEVIEEFIENDAITTSDKIVECLNKAKLCYKDDDAYEFGLSRITAYRNSPQEYLIPDELEYRQSRRHMHIL